MNKCLTKSSIGKKAVMAVTGIVLLGYVMGHLAGNLLIFLGPDAINTYAAKLHSLGPLLWVTRLVLLAAVGAHIVMAIIITRENMTSRPIAYHSKVNLRTTYAARTMMLSGLVVLAFIIFHILHFTVRITHPEISGLHDALGRHDVYSMVILSFKDLFVTGSYVMALALLCLHLSHGIASIFQTLGWNSEEQMPCVTKLSRILALIFFVGYVSIPMAAYFGCLSVTTGGMIS